MKETNKKQRHPRIATIIHHGPAKVTVYSTEQIPILCTEHINLGIEKICPCAAAQNQKKKEGKTMKTRKNPLRRLFASMLAVTTAAAILVAGTYGWSAISQFAKGTASGPEGNGGDIGVTQPGPGGRLHFDFDRASGAAEVYAENFGTDPLFVRVKLDITTDLTSGEVSYAYGGSIDFMPTFLKDSTKLYSDVSGDAIDLERESAPVPAFQRYTENEKKTDTAYYTDQTNALATHTAKSTLDQAAAPAPLAAWDGNPADRWLIDADGWAYWANPLQAGEATSLYLRAIEFTADRSDWDFVILPIAQFVDLEDITSFTDTTPEADELLAVFAPEPEPAPIVRGDSRILGAIGTNGNSTTTFWPAHGEDSVIRKRQVATVEVVNYIPTDLETNPIYLHSWDVSEAGDYSVMAWYTDAGRNNSNGEPMYAVFLGAEGTVKTGANAKSLFHYFYYATTIDISKLDTSNATNMYYMFAYVTYITSLDLSGFDTSNVTSMQNMFFASTALTSLDLSGFNTSNVTNIQQMFDATTNLKHLDMRNADFAKVTSAVSLFASIGGSSGLRTAPGTMIVNDDAAKTFINGVHATNKPATIYTLAEWQALGNP